MSNPSRHLSIKMNPNRSCRRSYLCVLAWVAISASRLIAAAPLTAVAFTPNGDQVVLGSQQGIELYAWPAMIFVNAIDTQLVQVHDLRFSPDGKILLAAGGSPAEEGIVEVVAWPSQERLHHISLHEDVVYRIAWSPDGSKWATASGDGTCSVIDAKSGERVVRYAGHSRSVLSLEFSRDAKSLLSVGIDQTLQLWNSESGEHRRTLDNHVGTINAVAVRPYNSIDSQEAPPMTVATISEDRTVRIWQPSIGRLMRFAKLASIPRTLAWSNAGDRLYVGCNDGHLREIDPDSMEIQRQFEALGGRIYETAIEPSGQSILVVGETGFRIHPLKPKQATEVP